MKNIKNVSKKPMVFISYSRQDIEYLKRLQVHLKSLERDNIITSWDDTKIKSGDKWENEIAKALGNSEIANLLISADFLASDFITNNELPPLLKAAEEKGTVILPVIVKPCLFDKNKNLSQFQAINKPEESLQKISDCEKEALYVKICKRVEEAILKENKFSISSSSNKNINNIKHPLDEIEVKILLYLEQHQSGKQITANDISKSLNITLTVVKFHLQELATKNMVKAKEVTSDNFFNWWSYNTLILAHDGRRYLIENKLIT